MKQVGGNRLVIAKRDLTLCTLSHLCEFINTEQCLGMAHNT